MSLNGKKLEVGNGPLIKSGLGIRDKAKIMAHGTQWDGFDACRPFLDDEQMMAIELYESALEHLRHVLDM